MLQFGDEILYEAYSLNKIEPSDDKSILNLGNTKIYNEVMKKLDEEYYREEKEILEELAPKYDMSALELKQFMFDYMEVYYAQ